MVLPIGIRRDNPHALFVFCENVVQSRFQGRPLPEVDCVTQHLDTSQPRQFVENTPVCRPAAIIDYNDTGGPEIQ